MEGDAVVSAYTDLVARGCLCGTDRTADCPLHGAGDNRGIAAFFRAGMPKAFPFDATCTVCGTPGLMYPDVVLDDPNSGFPQHRPTLVCPHCSQPAAEHALVSEVLTAGLHQLNDRRVFA